MQGYTPEKININLYLKSIFTAIRLFFVCCCWLIASAVIRHYKAKVKKGGRKPTKWATQFHKTL